MDDKKVFELKRLELAYTRQSTYLMGVMLLALIGVILYIINVYHYDLQMLLLSVMLIVVSVIGMLCIDSTMKEISGKIRGL